MKDRRTLFLIAIGVIVSGVVFAEGDVVVEWSSPEGIRRLERSQHKIDFFALANQFESQTNIVSCGPTTGAMVLNALRLHNGKVKPIDESLVLNEDDRLHLPEDMKTPVLNRYTPNTFLNEKTDR